MDTLSLLARASAGDAEALDEVVCRHRPLLVRWARGRLPIWARDLADTDDLVQNTLVKAIRNLNDFKPTSEGALQNYLREALKNAIRDELRKSARRPAVEELSADQAASEPTPLEVVIGAERLARYEQALGALSDEERSAVVARFELGLTHLEIAVALGKGTPDAARKLVQRATVQLLGRMHSSAT